ncbi:MAG TPA: hypothetical protein VHN99_00180, partial [Deinococcales bacterium]|nr:hypothetical protein [Deinococcales bacterium]
LDIGEGTTLTAPAPETFAPVDWESQLQHLMAELVTGQRDAMLNNQPGDPQFGEKMIAIENTFWEKIVQPLLPGIAANCGTARESAPKALSWAREAVLVSESSFQDQAAQVTSAVAKGADACWQEDIKPCVDQNDTAQIHRLLTDSRTLVLLGDGGDAKHDPFDPALACTASCPAAQVQSWTGTVSFAQSRDVTDGTWRYKYDASVHQTAHLTAVYLNEAGSGYEDKHPGGQNSITYNSWLRGKPFDSWSGSGAPSAFDPTRVFSGIVTLNVIAKDCSYRFYVQSDAPGTNGYVETGVIQGTFPGATRHLSGTAPFPVPYTIDTVGDTTPTWYLENGNVAQVLGPGNLGTVSVTWDFTADD